MIGVRFVPLLLAVAPAAAAQRAPVAPGEGFEVERYTVAIRPDLATTAVSGTETIVVRATADRVVRLAFTGNALRISEATADGAAVTVTSGKGGIVFALPRPLQKGDKAMLRFRIDGTPARGVTAAAGGLFTGYLAYDWMVCLRDAPGDKAHLALDLLLPTGSQSIGVERALRRAGTTCRRCLPIGFTAQLTPYKVRC